MTSQDASGAPGPAPVPSSARASSASQSSPDASQRRGASQRFAWFLAGVGCAMAGLTMLDTATAAIRQGGGTTIGTAQDTQQTGVTALPSTASGVTGDSNNRMIAVTGNDITGQSVLYLVDTIDKQLAVYQASGGSPGTQKVMLVGARNISLDLQLDGLNDKTEVDKQPLTYKDLAKRFDIEVDGGKTTRSGAPR